MKVEEQTDLYLFEFETEKSDDDCTYYTCSLESEWLAIFSCGHAPSYCVSHKGWVEQTEPDGMTCHVCATDKDVTVLRWEKL